MAKLLSVFLLCGMSSSLLAESPLYSWGGKDVYKKDLPPGLQQALYDVERAGYDESQRVVEAAILEQHINDQIAQTKKTREAVEVALFGSTEISDAEAKGWFEQNKDRLGGKDFNQIKTEIKYYLEREKKELKKKEVVTRLKAQKNFKLAMKAPVAPLFTINTQGHPSMGSQKAPVTIVEFADYKCPHCRVASKNLKEVVGEFTDKVRLVYIEFPLNRGVSQTLSIGAYCAAKQDKFWQYHTNAFENQATTGPQWPETAAKELGLNLKDFQDCLKSKDAEQYVDNSKKEGMRLGIEGTPAIYINGKKARSYEKDALIADIKASL